MKNTIQKYNFDVHVCKKSNKKATVKVYSDFCPAYLELEELNIISNCFVSLSNLCNEAIQERLKNGEIKNKKK